MPWLQTGQTHYHLRLELQNKDSKTKGWLSEIVYSFPEV